MRIPEAFKEWVRQYVAQIVQVAPVARVSANGETDQLEGYRTLPNEPTYTRQVNRFEPFGVRSLPVPGDVEGVMVCVHGGINNGVIVGTHCTKYGPSDLVEGEVQIYCKATGAKIKLDKDGEITVTSSTSQPITITAGTGAAVNINSGTGANVVVNGGSADVARVTTDTAGPYPIVLGAPSRLKTSIV